MTPHEESVVAKLVSLIVKIGALLVIFFMPTQFALDLQLLGGVWMVQIFPALVLGLFTRWFSGSALLIGWAAGMIVGHGAVLEREGLGARARAEWDMPLVGHLDLGLGFAAYNGLTAVHRERHRRDACCRSCCAPTGQRTRLLAGAISTWSRASATPRARCQDGSTRSRPSRLRAAAGGS